MAKGVSVDSSMNSLGQMLAAMAAPKGVDPAFYVPEDDLQSQVAPRQTDEERRRSEWPSGPV